MSEQGSSGEAPGGAAADAVAARARQRHARDKGLVEAARGGDRAAFGKLYDEWVDSVYDRAIHSGASAAEAREITEQTFLTAWRDLAKLKQPAAFGAKVMQVARRETVARVSGGEKIVPKSGPSAEERLTRATSAADTASDPEAAAILREAAHALDEQTRDILDLHFRLGLTRNEVAAVLGEQPDKVAQTITKLPPALAVLTRARVLWRGGSPEDDGLQEALAAENVVAFNASAVRTINRYAKDNDRARARSLMGIPPVELFAAIPLADAPAGLKTAVASLLVTESVPMDGSAFVKRDDKGEIVDAPKAPPPPDGSIRPGIENKRPTIDPKKAAVVAAAALAAERAADDETAAAALAADAAPAKSRRDRKADKNAEAAKVAPVAAEAKAADETLASAADLEARKTDDGGATGAKVAGAAAGGAVVGLAGAAAAGAAADAPDVADATAGVDLPRRRRRRWHRCRRRGRDRRRRDGCRRCGSVGGAADRLGGHRRQRRHRPSDTADTTDGPTDAPADDAADTAAAKDDDASSGSSSRRVPRRRPPPAPAWPRAPRPGPRPRVPRNGREHGRHGRQGRQGRRQRNGREHGRQGRRLRAAGRRAAPGRRRDRRWRRQVDRHRRGGGPAAGPRGLRGHPGRRRRPAGRDRGQPHHDQGGHEHQLRPAPPRPPRPRAPPRRRRPPPPSRPRPRWRRPRPRRPPPRAGGNPTTPTNPPPDRRADHDDPASQGGLRDQPQQCQEQVRPERGGFAEALVDGER